MIEYLEDAADRKGGVVVQGESKLEADLVVAADGAGTKSYMSTMGEQVRRAADTPFTAPHTLLS